MNELIKLTVEARDNVKFLATIERHFKNITYGSLDLINDTIGPMMNALRMIWIISRYFNFYLQTIHPLSLIIHITIIIVLFKYLA